MGNRQLRFYEHDRLTSIGVPDNPLRVMYAAGTPICQLGSSSFAEANLFAIDQANSVLASSHTSTVNRLRYCAYGYNSIGPLPVAPGYNGEYLEAFGVYLLGRGERGYSPRLRRFISCDRASIFLAGNLNAYAYTAGDPINYSDPSGNFRRLIARYKDWKAGKAMVKASDDLKYHMDSTQNLEYNIGHEKRKDAQRTRDIETTVTELNETEAKMLKLIDSMATMDDTVVYESSERGLKASYLNASYAKKADELRSLGSTLDTLSIKRLELEKVTSQVSQATWKLEQNKLAIQSARSRLEHLKDKYPHVASKAIRENL